jgi:hypothetical protein
MVYLYESNHIGVLRIKNIFQPDVTFDAFKWFNKYKTLKDAENWNCYEKQ